ncbi:Zinc finger C3HC4 type [Musa troglodytarum]|uniref:Zinc finger C3HC4 type n=2 Tax=Musa troglodytarum TaxID=320322 RepID=A0A9E7HLQ2_9LILI|nr:Zinc finger C3HC4 type [Musa troglodytarum]
MYPNSNDYIRKTPFYLSTWPNTDHSVGRLHTTNAEVEAFFHRLLPLPRRIQEGNLLWLRRRKKMGDHVVLHVDRLLTPQTIGMTRGEDGSMATSIASSCNDQKGKEESTVGEEDEPLILMVDCRICQEEDHIKNLEAPCACSGSLKYAHRACVQRWCSEKGDITCEICREQYKPGYIAPPRVHSDETMINVNSWVITGSQLNLHDPRVLAMTTSRGHLVEAEYAGLATDSGGAACFRPAALILMTILLLRHALIITNYDGDDDYDDDASTYISFFLLRIVGILFPCYIMVWIISILQQWRQRQEAAALAATEVSFILQSGQQRSLHLTLAPDSPATPPHESQQ